MPKGYLFLVLHAHLPYVHHPEYERFLEERWLFEAVTETYVPLVKFFDRMRDDHVPFRLTLSISPTLAAMLESEALRQRYLQHVELLMRLADAEVERTRNWPEVNHLAQMYRRLFGEAREVFVDRAGTRLLQVFRDYAAEGLVELITCAATHGYLPAFCGEPGTIRAQVQCAVHEHERLFGRKPRGLWLPECGYYPGLDRELASAGIRYTILESHALEHAEPRPVFGVHAPVYMPSGVAAFARHPATSRLVWSSKVGYPADPVYRDYYRDIGFDLEQGYLEAFQYAPGVRSSTGIKYHRITGRGDHKDLYNPDQGREAAHRHAADFVRRCADQVRHASGRMPSPAVIVSPYDAELFGHWWFEGPQWIDQVMRLLAAGNDALELGTPGAYLADYPVHQKAVPSPSSWGHNGYGEHWLNTSTAWMWRPLREASARMATLASAGGSDAPHDVRARALRQAARELLLAQSSDWPFMITAGTTEQYARRRFLDHLARFHDLAHDVERGEIEPAKLRALEQMDDLFPDVDFTLFGEPGHVQTETS